MLFFFLISVIPYGCSNILLTIVKACLCISDMVSVERGGLKAFDEGKGVNGGDILRSDFSFIGLRVEIYFVQKIHYLLHDLTTLKAIFHPINVSSIFFPCK